MIWGKEYRFVSHLRRWGLEYAARRKKTLYGWQGSKGMLCLAEALPPAWPNPYWEFLPDGRTMRQHWNDPEEATDGATTVAG